MRLVQKLKVIQQMKKLTQKMMEVLLQILMDLKMILHPMMKLVLLILHLMMKLVKLSPLSKNNQRKLKQIKRRERKREEMTLALMMKLVETMIPHQMMKPERIRNQVILMALIQLMTMPT